MQPHLRAQQSSLAVSPACVCSSPLPKAECATGPGIFSAPKDAAVMCGDEHLYYRALKGKANPDAH